LAQPRFGAYRPLIEFGAGQRVHVARQGNGLRFACARGYAEEMRLRWSAANRRRERKGCG
jgi:hypothetical protein